MKDAGVKIIYSLPEIKVHSKIALVRKKKGASPKGVKQSFAILSTGNFNEITAKFYTDQVLMTTDENITNELLQLFEFLQTKKIPDEKTELKFKELLVAQFNMVEELERLIETEIEKAKRGEEALIRIKVNNLEEPSFIKLLYKAGQAGVKINLIVRSICCLVPGITGESENITVKRIVDRYLEHSRMLFFGTDANVEVLMGSADLMTRNLRHRIEVYVRIKNEACKKELLNYFDIQWRDNDKAVMLMPGFQQQKINADGATKINAQQSIYNFLETKQ